MAMSALRTISMGYKDISYEEFEKYLENQERLGEIDEDDREEKKTDDKQEELASTNSLEKTSSKTGIK